MEEGLNMVREEGGTVEQLKCGMQMTQSEMYEIEIETQREARAPQGRARESRRGQLTSWREC